MRQCVVCDPTKLLKAKRMSIGTISHGRKKIAERKWVQVGAVKNGFSDVMIKKLRKEWSKLSTVNPESPTYKELIDKLDKMDINSLKQLMRANIKFVSLLAKIRVSQWMQRNPMQGHAGSYARPILQPVFKASILKAKYTRRWKGKDGKWHYEYETPKTPRGPKETIKIDASKRGWLIKDGIKFGEDLSTKNPGSYVTMHDVFGMVYFTVHNSLPKNVHAPGDFKYGYAHNGVWKAWSEKRKASYSSKMLEGVE